MSKILHASTSFATLQGALSAVRCWVAAAEAAGYQRSGLCALINTDDASTSATLGTRAQIAALLPLSRGGIELRRPVLTHAPEDTFVLISKNDGPANGDGLSNIDAVLAVTAARAAAQ